MDLQPLPPDGVDAELIEDTLRSPGYALIATRIADEVRRRTRALIDFGEAVDVNRGMIKGLELALTIPEIIASEGQKGKEKR